MSFRIKSNHPCLHQDSLKKLVWTGSERESETYHSGRRVDDFHLLEDRGTVVGNEHFALGRLNLQSGHNSALEYRLKD